LIWRAGYGAGAASVFFIAEEVAGKPDPFTADAFEKSIFLFSFVFGFHFCLRVATSSAMNAARTVTWQHCTREQN
jgi:hypothetical protein